ncbi:hypothetical protein DFR70_1093 [Nocardia tenerifensis]|uniref:Uncharacterized protein n=1 Tax=Nocardia tenerifensis TaxID=228006 RepID=A0A318JZP3_9NOCA|nr:DUF6519 domain-containing protein [Nocardia tenerifensis]PXX60812.1 hypothetical protein DFR70_1093 [Nocardia tenerifensis]
MRGDFSRLTPDPADYSLVLLQQGRVLVESDWNTAMSTLIGAQRTLAADLIGPHGGPADTLGFHPDPISNGRRDLELGAGVYYVDGIRVELPLELDKVHWSEQPYPIATERLELPDPPYVVYLDVWERHVSSLEDDRIREVALGGPDTTSRRQVIWQVRAAAYTDEEPSCGRFPLETWRAGLRGNPPLLRARTGPPTSGDDPCLAAPDAHYRGVENQLYRVEIAAVADESVEGSVTSFVWSRENGSVAAAWTGTLGNRLHVAGVKDAKRGFVVGDWVELTWDTLEYAGVAGTRVKLSGVDGNLLTIDPTTATGPIETDPAERPHAKVRRWDQRERKAAPLVDGAVKLVEGIGDNGWIPLENGIEIQFLAADPGGAHTYRVGDYWTIPARVATGDIIWPHDADGKTPSYVPPHGVEHHYAPLLFVGEGATRSLQLEFQPLAHCPVN